MTLLGSNPIFPGKHTPNMAEETKYSTMVIVGAGESGICMAAQLKKRLNFTDYTIYERHSDLGGTWWANSYPGCACDITSVFYSFSFAMNPRWTSMYPKAAEMHAYLTDVATKYNIQPRISFNTEVESASWDDNRQLWIVKLRKREVAEWEILMGSRVNETGRGGELKVRNEYIGETWTHECKVFITAVGGLVEPKEIPLEGREGFEGDIMHSGKWDHSVSLEDKNVIVIGNGCSSAQLVPNIADKVKSVTQISRGPHWIIPRTPPPGGKEAYAKWSPTLFTHIPLLMRAFRLLCFYDSESGWLPFKMNKKGEKGRQRQANASIAYIRANAPEKYWPLLIPKFKVGAKRRIFDDEYAACLQRDNVHLTAGTVSQVTEKSIITSSGEEYPADVIVFATGYTTNEWLMPMTIRGKGGKSVHDIWNDQGGPGAYNCTAVSGFPNFFMLFGPNAATGHSSVILATENMTRYAITMLKPLLRGEASEIDVKDDAYVEYRNWIQRTMKDTVWGDNEVRSWYVNEKGWNSTTYPRSQLHFGYRTYFPTYSDWIIKQTPYGIFMSRVRKLFALFLIFGIGAAARIMRRKNMSVRDIFNMTLALAQYGVASAVQKIRG